MLAKLTRSRSESKGAAMSDGPPQHPVYPGAYNPWHASPAHVPPYMHPLAHYQLQHFYAAQGLPIPPFIGGPSPSSSASASTPAVPSPTRSNVEPSPNATQPDQMASNPASVDTPSVDAENASPGSFAGAASASPTSPLNASTSSAAGKLQTQLDPNGSAAQAPLPPLSDPRALLQRSLQGMYQLVTAGNFDARPSRQGPGPPPKSGACAACRAAKAKCDQGQPACDRCGKMQLDCKYHVFNKRGRKRTRTPYVPLLACACPRVYLD